VLFVTAAAVAAGPTANARAGSADVAALQVAMSALGLYPHPVDGITGPWTVEAVRHFQANHGLTVDGVAGPQTLRALGRRGKPPLGSRPMRIGQRGFDVAALQFLLSSRGFGPGRFDGGYGPNTSAAVRWFQAAAGLAVDDVAGPATLNALQGGQLVTELTDPVRFLRPLGTPITDGFGFIPPGRWHSGIDFPAAKGTTVGAAGRGTVAFAGWNTGGYGYLVVVRHRLGYESWYRAPSPLRGPPLRHPDRPDAAAAFSERSPLAARPRQLVPRPRPQASLPSERRRPPHQEHRPAGRPPRPLPLTAHFRESL
jgi:peptidoglycan hydrolase-like protein with peptidoglycan-binding domain